MHDVDNVTTNVVWGGRCFITIRIMFLMRELELAGALIDHVQFDMAANIVSLLLLTSRRDHQVLGCPRTWGCICMEGQMMPCAFHQLLGHIDWLNSLSMPTCISRGYLFPSPSGHMSSQVQVVEVIRWVANLCQEPLLDSRSRPRFSGHSLCVSGAHYLSAYIEVANIKTLGRWTSEIIERGVRESPLRIITQAFRHSVQAARLEQAVVRVSNIEVNIKNNHDDKAIAYYVQQQIIELTNHIPNIVSLEMNKPLAIVLLLNPNTLVLHKVGRSSLVLVSDWRRCVCGWRFAAPKLVLIRPGVPIWHTRMCERDAMGWRWHEEPMVMYTASVFGETGLYV